MHTTATLHVHPAVASPFLIFEIRRLARKCSCPFATTKLKQKAPATFTPVDPNGGGRAA
jgi:hypothetical protein